MVLIYNKCENYPSRPHIYIQKESCGFECFSVLLTQPCLTLYDPMGCSPPGSCTLGILQASVLDWVAIPFCRGPSQPRDRTWVSCIAGRFFTIWATREAQVLSNLEKLLSFYKYHSHTHTHKHTMRYYSAFKRMKYAICSNLDGTREYHTK